MTPPVSGGVPEQGLPQGNPLWWDCTSEEKKACAIAEAADGEAVLRHEMTVDEAYERGMDRWKNLTPFSPDLRLRLAHTLSMIYARNGGELTFEERLHIRTAGELLTRVAVLERPRPAPENEYSFSCGCRVWREEDHALSTRTCEMHHALWLKAQPTTGASGANGAGRVSGTQEGTTPSA